MSLIGLGLLKTTLIDYPGEVAATLFTPGCNLRCPYCHNPGLVQDIDKSSLLPMDVIRTFLKKRAGVLGGVVITGGEPLMHREDLSDLVEYIHSLGLKVKLDTNGLYPRELSSLDVDFIAMDLKTSPKRYNELGYADDCQSLLEQSLSYIISSGISHQIRTTFHPDLINKEDAETMATLMQGVELYRLTAFRPDQTLNKGWEQKESPTLFEMEEWKDFFIKRSIPAVVE